MNQILNDNHGNSDPLSTSAENSHNGVNEDSGIKTLEESFLRKNLNASANARIVKLIKGGSKVNSISYVLSG